MLFLNLIQVTECGSVLPLAMFQVCTFGKTSSTTYHISSSAPVFGFDIHLTMMMMMIIIVIHNDDHRIIHNAVSLVLANKLILEVQKIVLTLGCQLSEIKSLRNPRVVFLQDAHSHFLPLYL